MQRSGSSILGLATPERRKPNRLEKIQTERFFHLLKIELFPKNNGFQEWIKKCLQELKQASKLIRLGNGSG